jgi:hypothetical protein
MCALSLDKSVKRGSSLSAMRRLLLRYPMTSLPRLPRTRYILSAEQRRALKMLSTAGSQGCAGAALIGQGFRVGMLAGLVGDGLATARRETMRVDKRKITIARMCITDAGQQAIKD